MTRRRTKKYVVYKNQKPMAYSLIYSAVMLLFSFGCVILPLILDSNLKKSILCFSVGGIGIAYFCFLIFYYSLRLSSKQPALIATGDGVTMFTMKNTPCFIPRDAISTIRVFGNVKNKYMGFVVEDIDSISGFEKRGIKRLVLNNIEQGLPTVIVSQREIKGDIKDSAIKIKEILIYGLQNERAASDNNLIN